MSYNFGSLHIAACLSSFDLGSVTFFYIIEKFSVRSDTQKAEVREVGFKFWMVQALLQQK